MRKAVSKRNVWSKRDSCMNEGRDHELSALLLTIGFRLYNKSIRVSASARPIE